MALLNDLIDMEFPEFVEKIQQNHNKLTEELVNAESKGQMDILLENIDKYYFSGKCNNTDDGNYIQEITHWDEWNCHPKYFGLPIDDNDIKPVEIEYFNKLTKGEPKPRNIDYCAYNKRLDILWAYDTDGIHWFYTKDGNYLFNEPLNEEVEPNKKVIAYHGSQTDNLQFYQNHAFYLTNNYELAKELAFKDGDGGLYDGEVATIYTCELDIKKPYETYSETEYENYFVDTQLDRDYWLNRGFDSIIVHPTEISQTTYYIMLNPEESVKIINKDIFDEYGNNINESVDEIKKLSGVKLDEKVMRINKEVSHTRLVTSAYELNEIIKNNTELRVLYDKERNFFLVDTPASVHVQMINDALLDGIYEPVEWNGYLITGEGDDYSGADGRAYYTINPSRFVLLRTSSDPNDFLELTDDNYRYCYHYKNLNYVIFDNTGDFVETPLYQLLGKPETIEHWDEDNGEFEILKESVEDARNINGYTTYMYKNPTMKELRDDKEANGEFRVVRVNDDFYFGDAEYWTHRHMNDSDDAIRLFYNLNNNTFYQDFETSSDEEYNEFYQEFVESMKEPYILNTFPNCKFKLFSKTKVDNDTPFYLNETIEYDRIRDSVFKYVMQSREIEEGYVITDYDYDNYITYYLPEDLIKKLIDESGYEETPELVEYVKDNYDTGVSFEIVKYIFNDLYERNKRDLETELSFGNKIYRLITSNDDIDYVIEQCKIHGTGNCWAKTKNRAQSYNGGKDKYDYIFEAEFNEEDVDWEQTMYLRMTADEDEIRLKKESKINVLSVMIYRYKEEEYGYSNVIEAQKEKPLNIILPVGNKYSY